jgi:hypothetical protein
MRGPWIVLGSAFTVVLLLSGAFQVVVFGVPWLGDKATEHATYTHPITKLVIEADNSDFRVRGSKSSTVTVTRKLKWHSDRPKSEETWQGDVLTIRPVECNGRGTCDIDYTIDVPADTEVDITATSGDLTTTGLAGPQTLSATSGDIDVRQSTGVLALDASSGDIGVRASEPSSIEVRTSSGDINVDLPKADYDVQAGTSSGDANVDVKLDDHSAYKIRARASSGDIQVGYR